MQTSALIKLTVATVVGVAILVGLGLWQLERLAWKEALIARVEARTERKPMSLEQAIELAGGGRNMEYYPVSAEGRFHHARERYLYALSLDGESGWHVITPLETVDGTVVLVDRGYVPDALREASTRKEGQIQEVVTVTGLVRTPEEPSIFVPDNDPEANQWFTRDLSAMARSMFPGGTVVIAPFFVEERANDVPGGWPKAGQTRVRFRNDHLQYALTWFGLALCLVVIYAVYVWGAYRGKSS